jgi:hypothetical protein
VPRRAQVPTPVRRQVLQLERRRPPQALVQALARVPVRLPQERVPVRLPQERVPVLPPQERPQWRAPGPGPPPGPLQGPLQ